MSIIGKDANPMRTKINKISISVSIANVNEKISNFCKSKMSTLLPEPQSA